MGRLSDLPLSIIETILCLIPIQEAGRTSVLSREWRYRWTKVPKLVFEENIWNKNIWSHTRSKLISAAGQVLLMHDGPIHEFTLSLLGQHVKIDHILTLLSRKTSLRKLELDFAYAEYRLPSSISTTLQHVLTSCPLLKTVILNICGPFILSCNDSPTFTKPLECLPGSNDGPTFTKLLECLPVIETLSLSSDLINAFEDCVVGRVPQELPTPLFHLKYLSIHDVLFSRHQELILAFLIKSSPNLEKLKILDNRGWRESYDESRSRVEFYSGIMLEHLKELEIKDLKNHKTRFHFMKLILARSPVLKKVRINGLYFPNEKFELSETLSGYSRASPEVQIVVDGRTIYY